MYNSPCQCTWGTVGFLWGKSPSVYPSISLQQKTVPPNDNHRTSLPLTTFPHLSSHASRLIPPSFICPSNFLLSNSAFSVRPAGSPLRFHCVSVESVLFLKCVTGALDFRSFIPTHMDVSCHYFWQDAGERGCLSQRREASLRDLSSSYGSIHRESEGQGGKGIHTLARCSNSFHTMNSNPARQLLKAFQGQ